MTDRESHERNTAIYRPAIQEYNIRYNRLCPRVRTLYMYMYIVYAYYTDRLCTVHTRASVL